MHTNSTSGTGFAIFPVFVNHSAKLAHEMFWYARKGGGGMRLLRHLEGASRSDGALAVVMSTVIGLRDETVCKALERDGYMRSEMTLIKRL